MLMEPLPPPLTSAVVHSYLRTRLTLPCAPQGTEDEVIHISCGKKLLELCPNKATPLWAAGYGHQVGAGVQGL